MDRVDKDKIISESGLSVFQKPEWVDMVLGKDYRSSISIMGDNILYYEPSGYATLPDIKEEVVLLREVVDEVFGDSRPIVIILDHAHFKGISIKARKYFIEYHKNQKRILGAIFINVSIPSGISIKLAKRLNVFNFHLFISKTYPEALNLASLLLSPEMSPSASSSYDDGKARELRTFKRFLDPSDSQGITNTATSNSNSWIFEWDGYSNRYELIDNNIAHVVPEGYMEEKHLEPLLDRMTKEFVRVGLTDNPYYYVVGYGKLDGTSRMARKRYIQFLLEWHKKHPFKAYIIYGASRFVKTIINISKHFIPFRVVIVKDFQGALEFIAKDQTMFSKGLNTKEKMFENEKSHQSDQTRRTVDELLRFLGDIDWEMDSSSSPEPPVDLAHPFSQVFDAISFIKTDLDQLLEERKQAEEKIRKSVEKYQTLISNISDFVYYHDLDGNFTETNFYSKSDLGITEQELIGRNMRTLIPERYRDEFDNYLKNIVENGQAEGIVRVMKKDGSEMVVEYRNSLIFDNEDNPTGVQGIGTDITHKIIAKHALRESEEKYKNILESIEEGYYEVDMKGNLKFFNDSLCIILGYPRNELLEMNYKEFVAPEQIDRVFNIYNNVFQTGRSVKGIRYEVLKKDHSRAVIEVSITLVRNSKGDAIGFRGIRQDVTKRIQAEEEKRQLEARLRQAQKMEAMGTLAGGVAHDLNNILSGIVSYPDLILMDLPKESQLIKPIQTIKKSGEKAATIVQDLLTLARTGISNREVLNLSHIVGEYLKSPEHERLVSYHPNVDITIQDDPDLHNIAGSPVHLNKIIMNLVSNAVEAIRDMGEVIISIYNMHLDYTYSGFEEIGAGEYVVLTVADNGSGICGEDLQRVFEPFYTKKTLGRTGTGLGMAVVWGTVKDHKGFIDVKSTEGVSTSISIYLPSTKKMISVDESPVLIERYMGKGEKVLIVDDVKEQREIATMMLRRLGYITEAVSSGEEAIVYIRSNTVDILVLDMIMAPGIGGLETYKRILEINPGQKAVIASGFSETDHVKEALSLGAGRYIKKPYTMETIGHAVRDEIDALT